MPTETQAVQLLEELGLTEYEARCFVALSRVPKATAAEINDLSEVPRSRVYDAVDRLHKRGLVDVQQSDPREYQAVSSDVALETLQNQYVSTVEEAGDALRQLHRSEDQEETGAWAIADHDHVTNRITALIDDAENEVYLLVVEAELIEEQVVHRLTAATERGAAVIVEVPTDEAKELFAEEIPAATVRQTALAELSSEVEGKRLGRMTMVDRDSVLISSMTDRIRPGQSEETAIWASGADHGLVVGLRHLLSMRIDNPDLLAELD